jgi:hypothetical protein
VYNRTVGLLTIHFNYYRYGIVTSKKNNPSKEIRTELQCKATASLEGEVVDELEVEDKSMGEFFKELEKLGEDEQE